MTNLLLNEKTIPTLARGFVQGVNNKVKMQDAITESMQAFIVDKNMQAKMQLENLWLALEGEGATESTATAPDLALISALETLDRMLKACKDTEQRAALKLAIARLAATV